jgi:CBS domain containing-hemolysin-like protein
MLVLAIFLVFLNGFFVLSEFAIVKVRKSRLEELVKQGKSGASLALKMSNSLDTYLSATQLGITFSSLA